MELTPILIGLTAISISLNIFFLFKARSGNQKNPSQDTIDVLHDLHHNGVALLKIIRVNPSEVFLRSPRGQ